jgi:hypothetical protein
VAAKMPNRQNGSRVTPPVDLNEKAQHFLQIHWTLMTAFCGTWAVAFFFFNEFASDSSPEINSQPFAHFVGIKNPECMVS